MVTTPGLRRRRPVATASRPPRGTPPSSGRRGQGGPRHRPRGVALFGTRAAAARPSGPAAADRWSHSSTAWCRPHPWLRDRRSGDDAFWSDARTGPAWRPFGDLDPALAIGFAADGPGRRPASTHAGHGTFLAGLVRQIAPDAQVLVGAGDVPQRHRRRGQLAQNAPASGWSTGAAAAQQGPPRARSSTSSTCPSASTCAAHARYREDGPLLDAIRALGRSRGAGRGLGREPGHRRPGGAGRVRSRRTPTSTSRSGW